MTTESSIHPAKDQLIAFGQGKLAADESSSVEQHLEVCPECCETLLDLKDDTFVGLVKIAQPSDSDRRMGTPARPEMEPGKTESDKTGTGKSAHPTDGGIANDSAHSATMLVQSGEAVSVDDLPTELQDHPRYRIVELIGRGGMGNVYRAEHRLMNRPVAIKLINSQLIRQPQAVERFRREVQAAAKLTHPNIVTAYDAEQAGDVHFLVMEFVEGTDLASVVKHRGPMSVAEACECIRQVAEGLQHAHEKGMVHRDIKPHNLMLSAAGQVRILDFGLAGFVTESVVVDAASVQTSHDTDAGSVGPGQLTTMGSVMGTPDYIAPEQAKDAHSADIRADIYSLGCTLHFLLTGKPPFEADNVLAKLKAHAQQSPPALTALRNDVPTELSQVVARMMAKNPAERFQTPAAVAEALAPFAKPAMSPPRRRARTRVAALWMALVALLAGVIFVQTDTGLIEIHSEVDNLKISIQQKDGGGIEFHDLQTGSLVRRLPSGEYEIKLKGDRNDIEIKGGNFKLSRWGKVIVTLNRKPDANDLATAWVAGKLKVASLRKFDAKEPTLTQDGVTAVDGAWKIDAAENRTARLFEVPNPGVEECVVLYRAKLKTENVKGRAFLEMWVRMPGGEFFSKGFQNAVTGTTGWSEYEIPFILQKGQRPDLVKLNVTIEGTGTVWIKDVELAKAADPSPGQTPDKTAWMDLLKLVDPKLDTVSGKWQVKEGKLECETEPDSKIAFPVRPEGSYRVVVKFSRDKGTSGGGPMLCLPVGAHSVQFASMHPTEFSALEAIDGAYVDHPTNPTRSKGKLLAADEVHTIDATVTLKGAEATIRVELDGKRVVDWTGNPNRFSLHPAWSLGDNARPGLRSWEHVRFESLQLQMLSGEAKLLRAPPEKEAWKGWPADAPPPAIAPFDAEQAKKHQDAWAAHLGVPVEYTNSIGMKFRLIPPGEFMMGSTPTQIEEAISLAGADEYVKEHTRSEAPQHRVILTQPIYLGIHEVTQREYETVTGANPSYFVATRPGGKEAVIGLDTSTFPVDGVNWSEAAEFCTKLSEKEQLKPFKLLAGTYEGNGYRIPTEAQWEFACKAGTTTKYWSGETDDQLRQAAWIGSNAGGRTHAVGELKSNPLGLYDIHGNVWEWVRDGWGPEDYAEFVAKPAVDPTHPLTGGFQRVLRGGSWLAVPTSCRASYRHADAPTIRDWGLGFRISLPVDAVKAAITPRKMPVATNRFVRDQQAADWVLRVGGKIRIDVEGVNRHIDKAADLPTGDWQISNVELWPVHLGPTVKLDKLAGLQSLRWLRLFGTQISDAGLQQLVDVPNLQYLDLDYNSATTRTGLNHIGQHLTSITVMGLHGISIRDDDLAELATLKNLIHLNLSAIPLNGSGLKHLAGLPALKALVLNGTAITDENLQHLAPLPLEQLELKNAPISDTGVESLARMKSLKKLDIRETKISSAGLEKLRAALPNCVIEALTAAQQKERWDRAVESVAWTPLEPTQHTATGGTTLRRLNDQSLLAEGPNPAQSIYTVVAKTSLKRVSALRLDVIRDDSLPSKGPGRHDGGTFELTGIEIRFVPTPGTAAQNIAVRRSFADFSQGGHDVSQIATAGKGAWAIHRGDSPIQNQSLILDLAALLTLHEDSTISVTLRHESAWPGANVGRFRLSATDVERAPADKTSNVAKDGQTSPLAGLKDAATILMYLNNPKNNLGGSVPVALLGREGRVALRFGNWLVVFEGVACDPKAGILGFSNFNVPQRGSSGEGTVDFGAGDKLPGVLIKFKLDGEQNELSINNNRFKLRGKATKLEFGDKAYDATNSLQTILVARDGTTRLQEDKAGASENPKQAAAVQAAQAWLKLADAGKFGECWETFAKFAKAASTREQVIDAYGLLRKPLGAAQTRVMQSVNSFPQLPGTPPGESTVVQFETTFSIGGKQLEQVALYWDQDKQWRVAGYNVTPAPSESKKGQDDPATEQKKQAALTAARDWLKLVDAGKYGEAWDASSKINKDGIKRDAMDGLYKGLFQPLGPIESRELKSNEYKTQLPRAPVGEYAVIQFGTQFTNGRVTETVVLTREGDGHWRVSGYFHAEDKSVLLDGSQDKRRKK